MLTSVEHENVVRCYEVSETVYEGRPTLYMALELLEGRSLAHALERGPLPLVDALRVAGGVARALHALHTRPHPIFHRDIKPGNIFLTKEGGVKLLDFGLAAAGDWRLSNVSVFAAGSRPYMAPEQFDGLRFCTERSDLYSLGVTFFQMVAGRVPFEADTDHGFRTAHFDTSPPLLVEVHPGLERGPLLESVQNVVSRLLAKGPKERYGSAAEVLEAIERALGGLGVAFPKVTRPEAVRRRRKAIRASVVCFILAFAAMGGWAFYEGTLGEPARLREAVAERQRLAGQASLEGRLRDAARELGAALAQAREQGGFGADELLRLELSVKEAEAVRGRAFDSALTQARRSLNEERLGDAERDLEQGQKLASTEDDRRRLEKLLTERAEAGVRYAAQRLSLEGARTALEEGIPAVARTRLEEAGRERPCKALGPVAATLAADLEQVERTSREVEEARGLLTKAPKEALVRLRALRTALESSEALARRLRTSVDPQGLGALENRAATDAIDAESRGLRGANVVVSPEEAEALARDVLGHLPPEEATAFRALARTFMKTREQDERAARGVLREGLRGMSLAERAWLLLEHARAVLGLGPGEVLVARFEGSLGALDPEADLRNPPHPLPAQHRCHTQGKLLEIHILVNKFCGWQIQSAE
jgi:hypothetical protein